MNTVLMDDAKKSPSRPLPRPTSPAARGEVTKLGLCIIILLSCTTVRSADTVSFRGDIAPILLENCVACHGAKKAEGGYRLDTFAELVKAGDSDVKPISSDKQQTSELLRRLTTADEFERMPAESESLSQEHIKLVSQ